MSNKKKDFENMDKKVQADMSAIADSVKHDKYGRKVIPMSNNLKFSHVDYEFLNRQSEKRKNSRFGAYSELKKKIGNKA